MKLKSRSLLGTVVITWILAGGSAIAQDCSQAFNLTFKTRQAEGAQTGAALSIRLCSNDTTCTSFYDLRQNWSGATQQGQEARRTLNFAAGWCGVEQLRISSNGATNQGDGDNVIGRLQNTLGQIGRDIEGDDNWDIEYATVVYLTATGATVTKRFGGAVVGKGLTILRYPETTSVGGNQPPQNPFQPPARPAPAVFSGQLLRDDGSPLAGATVTVYQNSGPQVYGPAMSDPFGRWQVQVENPAEPHSVTVAAPSFVPSRQDGVVPSRTPFVRMQMMFDAANFRDPGGNSLLHRAVQNGNPRQIEAALNAGTPVDMPNGQGDTALRIAIRSGAVRAVQLLLSRGANPNESNNVRGLPVDEALQSPQAAEMVLALGRAGADLRPTRFIDAAFGIPGGSSLLGLLLDLGGDANYALRRAAGFSNEGVVLWILREYPGRLSVDNGLFQWAVMNQRPAIALEILKVGVGLDVNQALAVAIQYNAPDLVEAAARQGADGTPVLQYAMWSGNRVLASKALTEFRADPGFGVDLAAQYNDSQLLELALNRGGDPNRGIVTASGLGNEQIVRQLLGGPRRADPNLGMQTAIANQRRGVIVALVEAGADPNAVMPYATEQNDLQLVDLLLNRNASARTPNLIDIAARRGHVQMVDMLVQKGASATFGLRGAVETDNLALARHLVVDFRADVRASEDVIVRAASQGNRPMVELLLGAGADANPGLAAAVKGSKDDLTRLFIERGADVKPAAYMQTLAGQGKLDLVTLLLAGGALPYPGLEPAVSSGRADVAKLLLSRGNPACPTPGCGPLTQIAARRDDVAMIAVLLDHGANPTAGVEGALACQDPACGGQLRALRLLIQAGANVTSPATLSGAVSRNSSALVQELLMAGAPIAAQDEQGQPLLHIATVGRRDPALMRVLLERGADPNGVNRAGDTVLHILARDRNSPSYAQFQKMERARMPLVEALLSVPGIDVNAGNAAGEPPLRRVDGGYMRDRLKQAGAIEEIARTPENCNAVPTLYADNLFKGKTLVVSADATDLGTQDFRNKASSICVPGGWTLVIFDKPSFEGSSHRIKGPAVIYHMQDQRPGGQSWDDRVASVRASRTD